MKKEDDYSMKTFLGIFLVLFFSMSLLGNAQNPYFSQYYASPLYLNPALVAANREISFGVNYRSQWNSDNAPYQTGQFSFIYPILNKGALMKHLGGAGLSVFQDLAGEGGIFKTYGIKLTGGYRLPINKNHTMLMGLQGGIIHRKLDYSDLRWGSQYDPQIGFDPRINPTVGSINEQIIFPVFDAGLFWYHTLATTNYYMPSRSWSVFGGFSASNMNRPDESVLKDGRSRLPILYKVHGGLDYRASRSFKFSPTFLLMQQNDNRQYNLGSYLTYSFISDPFSKQPKTIDLQAGVWYRIEDSFIFLLGGSRNNISFGFSYDMNITSMRYNNLGAAAYEISLTYRIKKGEESRNFSTPLM